MQKPNIVLSLMTIAMLCSLSLKAQFQWTGGLVGPNPSIHCGSTGIRVGFSNNQNCTFLMPSITLQFRPTASSNWGSIAVMVPTSPGATGDYYDFPSPVADESGYYRAIISTASGYTPCSGQTVASYTTTAVQHIVNAIPVADFNINGGVAGIVQTYQCATINMNYTGSGTANRYRYKIEECTAAGVPVSGGYSSNAGYAWVNGTLAATTDLNTGAVATRFDNFPGYYLVTLQVGTTSCVSGEKKVRIYVNNSAPAPVASFKINNAVVSTNCNSPMGLFACASFAVNLNNLSSNAVSYNLELAFSTSNCGPFSPVYSSGFVPVCPVDLKTLPVNGGTMQDNPGFYKISLTAMNSCGVVSSTQVGYFNAAGAPSASAAFTTSAKTKPNASQVIDGCTVPLNTGFRYDVGVGISCNEPGVGYRFPMEQTNPATPDLVGKTFTVFDLSGVTPGTGSAAYSVSVTTERYVNGVWENLNYQQVPEDFTNVTDIPLQGLLNDNEANPFYGFFGTPASLNDTFRISITITNECNSHTRRQIIKLISQLASAPFELPAVVAQEDKITVSPNPATDKIKIALNGTATYKISIYNELGQVVAERALAPGTVEAAIDMSSYATGLYLLKLETGSGAVVKKVMKK